MRAQHGSQSSHGNPAYRCRHGHTSAHTTAMRQTANLYLREDVIIGRILAKMHTLTSTDAGIVEDITRLQQNRNVAELIVFLRTHGITIECSTTGVSLEPDHEKAIIASLPANAPREGHADPTAAHPPAETKARHRLTLMPRGD